MSIKKFCDGCKSEIPRFRKSSSAGEPGDGYERTVRFEARRGDGSGATISSPSGYLSADLCLGCTETWFAVMCKAFPALADDLTEWQTAAGPVVGGPPAKDPYPGTPGERTPTERP